MSRLVIFQRDWAEKLDSPPPQTNCAASDTDISWTYTALYKYTLCTTLLNGLSREAEHIVCSSFAKSSADNFSVLYLLCVKYQWHSTVICVSRVGVWRYLGELWAFALVPLLSLCPTSLVLYHPILQCNLVTFKIPQIHLTWSWIQPPTSSPRRTLFLVLVTKFLLDASAFLSDRDTDVASRFLVPAPSAPRRGSVSGTMAGSFQGHKPRLTVCCCCRLTL